MFTRGTALASLIFAKAYPMFFKKSSTTDASCHPVFGDETASNAFEFRSMVWAECEIPSRLSLDDIKQGLSSLLFMNGARYMNKAFGNI